ncbi:unnamed protein product [Paramecium pentaurelia]|uniref:Uncharacterized protein n=1 Tax=Paramecium pentaurelia TaxID=43138 RepID=A0A8S1T6W1_9CILI|nr:unnamed protein product [Paramecium pentaurelia]
MIIEINYLKYNFINNFQIRLKNTTKQQQKKLLVQKNQYDNSQEVDDDEIFEVHCLIKKLNLNFGIKQKKIQLIFNFGFLKKMLDLP